MKKTKIIVSLALLVLFAVFSPLISVAIAANEQVTPSDVEIVQQVETTQVTPSDVANVEQAKPAALQSRALLPNEVIVTTFAQFKSAVETANNGITTIYFGADITMTGSITINPAKANIIIDGTNPNTGIMHILTEVQSAAAAGEIYLATAPATPATIVLRNVIVIGYNYYGTITIFDGIPNQTVRYENIDYTGPQMIYNVGGTAQIANSNITILTQYSAANEVGEMKNVQLEGNVTIDQQTAVTYNVFNFYPNTTGSLIVKSGANVDIKTRTTLGYGSFGYNQEANSNVTIHQLYAYGSIISDNNYNNAFIVGNGATLTLSQEYATGGGVLFDWYNASSNMQINGGTLNINSTGIRTASLLNVGNISLNSAKINFNYPATFGYSAFAIGSATSTFDMVNSTITANMGGSLTSTTPVVSIPGAVSMNGSKIVVNAQSGITSRAINIGGAASLTNSELSATVTGNVTTASQSTPLIQTSTLPTFNASSINAKVTGTSGALFSTTGNLAVGAGSSINLYANSSAYILLPLTGDVSVVDGGKMKIELVTSTSTTAYLLQTNSNVSFNANSNVQLITRAGSVLGLINTTGSGKSVVFNDPALVVLYGPTSTAKLITNTNVTTLSINAQQVNQWSTFGTYENTGGYGTMPQHRFIKSNLNNYTMTGSIAAGNAGATTISSTNYVVADGTNPIGNLTFTSTTAKVMAFGKFTATFPIPTVKDTSITGNAPATSVARITYTSGATQYTTGAVADATGTYKLTINPIDNASYTQTINFFYLYQEQTHVPNPFVGSLQFVNVPSQMAFQTTAIPTQTTLIQRVDPAWAIAINDDRTATPDWQLSAKVIQPLTPSDASKPALNNAFVFVDSSSQKHYLSSTTPTIVKTTKSGPALSSVSWAANQGMMLEINPGAVYSGIQYTGVIEWSLISAP